MERKHILTFISAATLFLLTLGCSASYQSSVSPTPADLPQTFSLSGDKQLHRSWWHDFGDNSLSFFIEKALSDNKNLLAVAEKLMQSQALARKAGADLIPSLDITGSVTKSRSRTDGITSTKSSLLLGFAASYEIDLWGRLQATEDASIFTVRATEQDIDAAALSLAAQVANVWYRLAASFDQLDLLKQQLEVNEQALQLIQLRFNAGQVGISDILQQKQLIESKNGELAQERATAKVLQNQLAVLCGIAPGKLEIPVRPQLINLPQLPQTGVPSDLLNNRPDIQSSFLSLLAADKTVAAAVANRYPRLSISANLNTSGTHTRDLFDNWLASLAANVVGPLLDGGLRRAEVDRTKAVAREKLHLFGDSVLGAVAEVEDALIQEKEQQVLLESLGIQLQLATKTLENLKDRYKHGVEDYQRVLSAQLSQASLQRSLVSGHRQLISYRIDLYRALGGRIAEHENDETQLTTYSNPLNQ